jgi:hypothetical protein
MKELESKSRLTANEREELSSLRGAEYARLKQNYEEDPNSLLREECSKLDRYKAQDQAAQHDAGPDRKEKQQQREGLDSIRFHESL